jgi:hypothetical protein
MGRAEPYGPSGDGARVFHRLAGIPNRVPEARPGTRGIGWPSPGSWAGTQRV